MTASALYLGRVTHRRFAPKAHALDYGIFQLLLDLDEAAPLGGRLRWFSVNRLNLFSHFDRDHGDGRPGPLRAYVEETLARGGVEIDGGPIRLLCMPRILGYVFNPLSIYYCHRPDGRLAAILYEVNNTFGQRHSYLIPADPDAEGRARQACDKGFHVSPFMGMDLAYEFDLPAPAERIITTIHARGPDGALMLAAAFAGRRQEITDRALLTLLFAYPLMTIKVVAAIHWEAAKMVLKGLRLQPRPADPPGPVTIVRGETGADPRQTGGGGAALNTAS